MGGGRFLDVARPLGADSELDGRGVAIADLDGDGRLDVVIANNDAPPTIYLNRLRSVGNWTRMNLRATKGNRDALGAMVRLTVCVGERVKTMTRQVEAGSSYASQSEGTIHFGLGRATKIEAIDVVWRKGVQQHFEGPEVDGLVNQATSLDEGGKILAAKTPATARTARPLRNGQAREDRP